MRSGDKAFVRRSYYMDESLIVTPELIETGYQIIATKTLFLASFTFLFYDHLLTLKDEVRYFWSQRLTLPSILFFLNRYYTHFSYAVIAYLFMNPGATDPKTFVRLKPYLKALIRRMYSCFPASMFLPLGGTLPISLISSLILTTRVYAIYNRNKFLLLTFLAALLGTSIWLYGFAGHVPLPLPPISLDAYRICIDATSPQIPQNTTITWILMQCSFDLTVLALTLGRSIRNATSQLPSAHKSSLFRIIQRDGVIYFLLIFTSNFAWAMMVLTAAPGIKYIIAIPNLAICATAASRISLNLRARACRAAYASSAGSPHSRGESRIAGVISLDASIVAFNKAQIAHREVAGYELEETSQGPPSIEE